jgi:hypothetical protein
MSEELNAAIAEVSAEASKELETKEKPEATPEVTPETTPETTPEATPEAKPEDKPEETPEAKPEEKPKEEPEEPEEDETTIDLSTDLLKAINDNPETLGVVYKKMQAGLTKGFQAQADERKLAKIARWMQENPDAALDELAKIRGRTLASRDGEPALPAKDPETTELVDDLTKEWEKQLGPKASNLLKPLIEKTVEAVTERLIESKVKPVQDETRILSDAATASGIKAAVKSFGSVKEQSGLPWSNEIAKGMGDAMTIIHPTDEATSDQYLDVLYNDITTKLNRTTSRRSELRRLKEARDTTEPSTSVRPTSAATSSITADMNDNDAVAAAVAMAQRDMAT